MALATALDKLGSDKMTKFNTALLPLYSSVFAGIVAYIVNFSVVETILQGYVAAGSIISYQLTLMEAPLRFDLDLLIGLGAWAITGIMYGYHSKDAIKGLIAPLFGMIASALIWSGLLTLELQTDFITVINSRMPFFIEIAPFALAAAGLGGVLGLVVGRIRWRGRQKKAVVIPDPVIEFIPTCPNCKTKNHSNAVFCAVCGTEIYEGLGKDAMISEEQETVTGIV